MFLRTGRLGERRNNPVRQGAVAQRRQQEQPQDGGWLQPSNEKAPEEDYEAAPCGRGMDVGSG
jgi:hypothetical protein